MGTVSQQQGMSYLLHDATPQDVLTPEDMGEEPRMMMKAIADFAAQEVEPVMDDVEARNIDVVRPLFKKAADLGIYMAEVPEEYGGLGLSVLALAAMSESRSYLGSLSSTVFAHQGIGCLPLVNFGTQAQIDKYLEKCMSGETMACFALTEPSSGSDAMNIRTTAVLNEAGTHYVVNGAKQFITNAGWADLFILFAKIDGDKFTAFLMDRELDGITIGENEKLLGLRGSSVCPISLVDVQIPAENVLGEIGRGHKVALCTLNLGRLKMSTNCVGGGKKMLGIAARYADERTQFGKQISEFGLIRQKLADMTARLYATQSMSYRTAGLVYDAVESMPEEEKTSIEARLGALTEFASECAMSKVHGAEMANFLADETLQIHGGYGFTEEYPAAKLFRDWRITRIYEGTSEICRMTVMKTIIKKSARGDLAFEAAYEGLGASDESVDSNGTLESLRGQIAGFKQIFQLLLGKCSEKYGQQGLLDDANQQLLSSLADIAIETYAAESTILRVIKLSEGRTADEVALPDALARIYFQRAAARIDDEAREILSIVSEGDGLRKDLNRVSAWLPLPANMMAVRNTVAETMVERNGELPDFQN